MVLASQSPGSPCHDQWPRVCSEPWGQLRVPHFLFCATHPGRLLLFLSFTYLYQICYLSFNKSLPGTCCVPGPVLRMRDAAALRNIGPRPRVTHPLAGKPALEPCGEGRNRHGCCRRPRELSSGVASVKEALSEAKLVAGAQRVTLS